MLDLVKRVAVTSVSRRCASARSLRRFVDNNPTARCGGYSRAKSAYSESRRQETPRGP